MALIPITPPAGIVKNGTDYTNKGRWVDGNLVRFENGYLKPIGGWDLLKQEPVGRVLSGTVSTTASSFIITITTTSNHDLAVGDTVSLVGFATTGGMPDTQINQTYTIASVPSATTFTINTFQANVQSIAATSSKTSSASSVVQPSTPIAMYAYNDNNGNPVLAVGTRNNVSVYYNETWYDITPSNFITDDAVGSTGFGAADFGEEDFGDARASSTLSFPNDSFSFDNWGEELVFCFAADGKLYRWQPSAPATIASAISNAPVDNIATVVSNERHLFALGSGGDPRKIAWSEREDNTNWTSLARNTAGDIQIPTGGQILYGLKYKSDIIVFTDIGINRVYYLGAPFTYGIAEAGTNCKAISVRSIVQAGDFVAWLGENSVFAYDGTVKEIPCEVHDYIYNEMSEAYRKSCWGGHNQNFNEIWWGFPSGDNQTTPNKYVIWNYRDNTWSIGELDRSCWVDQGAFDKPIAGDSSGFIYEHESGVLTGELDPFCQSGPLEIGQGDKLAQVNQIIPDEEANALPGVTISFTGKFTPLGSETNFGSFTFDTDGYTDARFSARQVKMKVTRSSQQDFQVGQIRLDVKARGKR